MFQTLQERLSGVFDKLTGRGALSESDVNDAMREVRRALLEADVALDVVKDFIEKVKAKAVGAEVLRSIKPGQMVVKIVHDELVAMLGSDRRPDQPCGAAARRHSDGRPAGLGQDDDDGEDRLPLTNRDRKKVLMASLDTRRPAAQEQLRVLGEQTGVATLPIVAGQTPIQIARRAEEAARTGGYDIVIFDTAGRVTVDEELMDEVRDVKAAVKPHEVLLVADALTGQDAVNTAKAFDGHIGVTGIVLTRADGDGRGGAALSMRAVTGKPIKLIGVGEKWDALEDFDPKRIAGRILGMGDVDQPRRKSSGNHRHREGDQNRRKDEEGRLRPRRHVRAVQADGQHGRHGRHHGNAAWHGQGQRPDRRSQGQQELPAYARHDFLDDAEGTAQPEDHRRQEEAAHRGRAPAPRPPTSTS